MSRKFFSTDFLPGLVRVACGMALSSLWLAAQQPGSQGKADVIFHNGKILTVDKNFSIAEAVAITGNKFTKVGRNQEVLQQAGPNTLRIDLKGETVVPGLMDTHINDWSEPGGYRKQLPPGEIGEFTIDWRAVSKKEDVVDQIRAFMEKYKPAPGKWLRFQNDLSESAQFKILYDDLNRYDLDQVTPDHPVVLTMSVPNENFLLVNTKALDILWKNEGDFLKKYGRYWLGRDGQPDGRLEPPITRILLAKYMPRATAEEMASGYRMVNEELNGWGITTIANKMRLNSIEAFKLLEKRREQTVRLAYGLGWDYFGVLQDPDKDLKQFQGKVGTGTDMNWVDSVAPSSIDGSGSRACTNLPRTGAFAQNVASWFPNGQCLTDSEYHGGARRAAPMTGNYFREWMMAMGKYGIRLADDHVAGDRTAANLLDMIEQIQKQYGPNATKNWDFDHCAVMNPDDIPRAARLGVVFGCTAFYIADSPQFARMYGEKVANTFVVPVKTMIDSGSKVGYNSATYGYIWDGLELFVTRKGKDGKVWGPQERLDRPSALRTATQWNADYVLKGDKLGSIEPGKLADLVVLNKDYLGIPAEEIHTLEARLTMSDGRIVFVHTDFANEYNLRPKGAVISTREDLEARRPDSKGGRTGNDGLR